MLDSENLWPNSQTILR